MNRCARGSLLVKARLQSWQQVTQEHPQTFEISKYRSQQPSQRSCAKQC